MEKNSAQLKKLATILSERELSFVQQNTLMAFFEHEGEFAPGHSLGELDRVVFDLAYGLGV